MWVNRVTATHFRCSSTSGHHQTGSVGPFCAKNGSGHKKRAESALDDRRSDSHVAYFAIVSARLHPAENPQDTLHGRRQQCDT